MRLILKHISWMTMTVMHSLGRVPGALKVLKSEVRFSLCAVDAEVVLDFNLPDETSSELVSMFLYSCFVI